MSEKKEQSGLKILNAVFFLVMVSVNALANILPLNGINTGAVAEQYPNLFAPAPYAFLIWGLIYLLLAGFVLFQFGAFGGSKSAYMEDLVRAIGPYFILSSVANTAWIFAWHYNMIGVSVILMLILLYCLSVIVFEIGKYDLLPVREKIFVKYPFSIYFGWITAATIANITVFLVSVGWNGWGISQQIWTVIALLVGLAVSAAVILKNRDVAYGLAVMWAYAAILFRHLSPSGFGSQYPGVIWTAALSLAALAAIIAYVLYRKRKNSIQ